MIARLFVAIAGSALAGCSSLVVKDRQAPSAPSQGAEGFALGALAEAALPKGECGMTLYTLEADTPVPIFRYVVGKGADIVLDGEPKTLTLADSAGAAGFGVFEEQEFTGGDGLVAQVRVRFGLGFDGGSYVERGIIDLESQAGWKTVVPAAGVAGCRAK